MLLCVLLAFLLLAYPIYVIRPFRHQGAHELAAALVVLRLRPAVEIVLAAFAIWFAIRLWKAAPSRWGRTAACLCAVLVVGFAVLCKVNIYEQMFHPLVKPEFSPASQSKLDGAEQVIAVRIANAARAYPVRSMSYHHIVNDRLAGLPIVATY